MRLVIEMKKAPTTTPTGIPKIDALIDWLECEAFYQADHKRPHAAKKLRRVADAIEHLSLDVDRTI